MRRWMATPVAHSGLGRGEDGSQAGPDMDLPCARTRRDPSSLSGWRRRADASGAGLARRTEGSPLGKDAPEAQPRGPDR